MKTMTFRFFLMGALMLFISEIYAQTAPATLPATPTVTASNAIFLYNSSGAYANAVTFNATDDNQWGGLLTESTYSVSGKNLICLTPTALSGASVGLYYHGATLSAKQNVASMKYLHVDVWIPAASNWTDFAIAPISSSSPTKNGQPLQSIYTSSSLGSWVSYDIDLAKFSATGLVDLSIVDQFIFKNSGNSSIASLNNNKVYLDNIYFWTDTSDSNPPVWDTTSPVTMSSSDETSITLSLLATDNSGAVNYSITDGTNTYTGSGTSGTAASVKISGLTPSTTYNFTVTLTDPSGNAASTTKSISASTTSVIPSAETPTMAASNVTSFYSEAYTSLNPAKDVWYATSITELPTGTATGSNKALKISSTDANGCFGLDLSSSTDISSRTKLHVDIYPLSTTTVQVGIMTLGGEAKTAPSTLTANTWNSVDIALSDLQAITPAITLATTKQIGFWTIGSGVTFYIDNALFYTGNYSGIEHISDNQDVKCNFSNDQLVISSGVTVAKVVIYNQLGQLLKSVTVNDYAKTINLSGLASGCYVYAIYAADGKVISGKFLK